MTFYRGMSPVDTPGEGRWWHVYTEEWCSCILTVSRITYLPLARVVSHCLPCGFRLHECPSAMV